MLGMFAGEIKMKPQNKQVKKLIEEMNKDLDKLKEKTLADMMLKLKIDLEKLKKVYMKKWKNIKQKNQN